MKSQLLVSALLLGSNVAQVNAQNVKAEAVLSVENGQVHVFETSETFFIKSHNHGGEVVEAKYRLTFSQIEGSYTYATDARRSPRGLDFEVTVEAIEASTGKVIYKSDSQNHAFLAKRVSGSTYKLFDCDESRTCRDTDLWEDSHSELTIDDVNGELVLQVEDDLRFYGSDLKDIVFTEVK